MSEDYDNNNRGACWGPPLVKVLRVTAEIDHRQFHGIVTRTNANAANAPSHNLWLRADDNKTEVYCIAIFLSSKGGSKLAGGEFTTRSGVAYWVSLFRNKSDNPKSPEIDLSFQAKEAESQEQSPAEPDDGVPF